MGADGARVWGVAAVKSDKAYDAPDGSSPYRTCHRCGRTRSKSAGCPDACHVQTAADVLMKVFGLERVTDRDIAEYIATSVPVGRVCEHCHGRKCKGECVPDRESADEIIEVTAAAIPIGKRRK